MAYKVFSNGDALTGSEINTYLMNQAVISFASTTARDAALPSPTEGQLVWLEDSNKYVYYTGSAWSDLITPASSGNAIINGAFDIWQRGTSFSNPASVTYTADRFRLNFDGTGATRTISRETFTPGTAPVSGYESAYHLRYACTVAGSGNTFYDFIQPIEDVRTFAGQTVTLSFWAKAASAVALSRMLLGQNFGSGGSSTVYTTVGTAPTLTTSWARYSFTVAVPSISGKTVGTSSALELFLGMPTASTATVDIWGIQLESGSSATAFKRNGDNVGQELASCQRYYVRYGFPQSVNNDAIHTIGRSYSSTNGDAFFKHPVTLRTVASSVEFSSIKFNDQNNTNYVITNVVLSSANALDTSAITFTSSGMTASRLGWVAANTSASAYVGFSAEL